MTARPAPTGGTEVQPQRTYPGSVVGWLRERYAMAVRVLTTQGLPFDLAAEMARAYLAHWAIETSWGRSEQSFNVGMMHASGTVPANAGTGWHGAYYEGIDDGLPTWFRAYETAADGVADYVHKVSHAQYVAAYHALLAAPADVRAWFQLLLAPPGGAAGFHPLHAEDLDEIVNVTNAIGRRVRAAA